MWFCSVTITHRKKPIDLHVAATFYLSQCERHACRTHAHTAGLLSSTSGAGIHDYKTSLYLSLCRSGVTGRATLSRSFHLPCYLRNPAHDVQQAPQCHDMHSLAGVKQQLHIVIYITVEVILRLIYIIQEAISIIQYHASRLCSMQQHG